MRSHLARFARARFALRAHENFRKKSVSQWTQNAVKRVKVQKIFFTLFDPLRASRIARSSRKFSKKISVSQSTRNTLKRIEMQKKTFYPFDRLRALRVAQSASGEAQPYLPHVTRRVPRSDHAKFHADWTKTVGARGIQTNRQTDRAILII